MTSNVCLGRESSVPLAERAGATHGLRCNPTDVLSGAAESGSDDGSRLTFSPFGLGVLEIALARLAGELAAAQGAGTSVPSFQPAAWAWND